jgi:NAD(P) transhydrogenase
MFRLAGITARRSALSRLSSPAVQQTRALTNLKMGVLKESLPTENRVALAPQDVEKLVNKGASVMIEKGAGAGASYPDALYEAAGASIGSAQEVWKQDLVSKVTKPSAEELKQLGNRAFIGMLSPRTDPEIKAQLAAQGATAFSMDMLLRTLSRGQAFDVLSSQANMSGYRAVIEAGNVLQRPFAGQSTAAGKIPPTRVMVVGAGVAGLAAIQAAKNLGAIVTSFDVRAAAAEQVEAMGAKFLSVDFEEDGSGAGGYAKEMSAEWFAAADKMLEKECANTDVIITTALIPGMKAPTLIKDKMVAAMPRGGVTVDLAAEAGGNVTTTRPGESYVTENGITCIGYTNLPSRMAQTSTNLFSGNISKFLLSMNKEDKEGDAPDTWHIDLENDEAVRSICCVHKGNSLEPYMPPPPEVVETAEVVEAPPPDPKDVTMSSAKTYTGVALGATMLGAGIPNAPMLSTFALSVWVGSSAVQGVTHALHSPLMAMTNAISGMTILGGMLQLDGGLMPGNGAQVLGASAVALSAVNLTGGTIVTQKMLDLFRRDDDPPEYNHYYLLPFAGMGGYYALSSMAGWNAATITPTIALASGIGCVGGIACLSSQETARAGVYVGMGGIGLGLCAALSDMAPTSSLAYTQLLTFGGLGGLAGYQIAKRIEPTSLPQAVAGFHVLVGLAAAATASSDFLSHDLSHMDGFHATSLYMGAWLGSITATGSVVACGKLAEIMDSSPLQLAGRDYINVGLGVGSAACLGAFLNTGSDMVAGTALLGGLGLSGGLGYHMTASIGGADMPVVITLLNSYSGWALCAEGFILNQPVLTIVGALIGSSGAFLTKIMCDGMNRSLPAVILGGFGTEAGAVQTSEGLEHTEIQLDGAFQALDDAQKVMITPGYGLAVAQAQGAAAEMANLLVKDGTEVTFGVHPVAGRMPGQLNVLLAEAGVPYDMVLEMEEVNEEMEDTDVVMVVGANDTVNKIAEDDPNSALGGMPVIQVWKAKHVLFMKRSMASGYAGVDNPTFYVEPTDMFLGDAKENLDKLVEKFRNK